MSAADAGSGEVATLRALLSAGDEVPLLVTGWSMTPFYLHRRTVVILRQEPARPPRVGDAVLFLRQDGTPVLHRILRLYPDGTLTVGGDAQCWTEVITPEQILGRVVGVRRQADRARGRTVSTEHAGYRLAVRLWRMGRWWHPAALRWYRRAVRMGKASRESGKTKGETHG